MQQLPNIISIFRTALTVWLAIKVLNDPTSLKFLVFSFWLTWFIIALDGIDGIIARKLKVTSDFGSFIDIACDRIVELIFISLFAVLEWIPFWILIVFLIRGVLVDGVRGLAQKKGKTAFGEKSMMKTKLGLFLTSSRFMRAAYGGIKAIAFAFMFLVHSYYTDFIQCEMILIYLMTFMCIIRGIPVLLESREYL